ncbi:alanine racemase [Campylobacter showae]|jgi:alanine racemase|uniref:alanine racemase n=1 Tax=Campylobacter showae TaxID=204 RepID=UPI000F0910E1|nr:alanine racemase [Campylobacter showae]
MSELVLNRSAYIHNLTKICAKAGGKDRVILVLKDNAYGHGAALVGREAASYGIKFCAVKNEIEACELEPFFEHILILSHIPHGGESERFIYAVNDISLIAKFKKGVRVHIAVDTLMHRNGVAIDEVRAACEAALTHGLQICGAFTHFRSAEELSGDYFVQRQNFAAAKAVVRAICGGSNLTFHSHNSAATERFGELAGECVRVGIAAYGYAQFDESLELKHVASLWAYKVSGRVLKKGQCAGYGAKFCASEDMKIAVYDLGYGDGLLRYTGEGELKTAGGQRLLGKMSMDSFCCEDVGDKICVFDDARVWADFFGTISYDVLTKLSPSINRRWG